MSETNMKFCSSYFLVDPTKASLFDLFLLLFFPNLTSKSFIDSTPDTLKSIRRSFASRWIIALAVLVQKILILIRKPMAFIGRLLTYWPNLLSENGGFFKLILHLVTGKLLKPEESSAIYTSFLGCSDRRVALDEKINVATIEYKSMLSIMASKIAYENKSFITSVVKNTWKMDFVGFYDFYNAYQERNLTQAFVFKASSTNPNLIVVSFRGTEPFDADDWCTDLDVSWYEMKNVGKIHAGFSRALGLQKNGWPKENISLIHQYAYYTIRQKLRDMLAIDKNLKFILTGHSLGGAIAALFPAILAVHGEDVLLDKLEGVYTFGQPRIGDEQFGEYMKEVVRKHGIEYERFVYNNDMVPRVPFDDKILFSYKHYGSCNYFNSLYKGKVREDAPNANYINLLWLIPTILTGAWEFIRSFIIQFWKGKEYKENWMMRSVRIVGIVLPGMSNHFPFDYVNCSRLGGLAQPSTTTHEDKIAFIA
ncbi:triacylglycerol lipase OBL1 isoform X2 [Raphanus sativus]|uniref:Triacylglycerol lipase OBL1 isoform X2 n=1 Tax=Raphanus sativus TaxID=3726 RepID=A0A9W3BVM0_RAPSA|nr:triacylglycerol lipase OBL1 isoform X2 [Raphanus sativus]